MRGFWKLTWIELKLFLRESMAAFFTLAFPLMMLFLFGSIFGNKPTPSFGGFGFVDVAVPAYMGMIIATSGLLSLTISMASYRERGILRRLKATPLRPQTILGAQVIVIFLMTALGMILLVIAGKVVYDLRFNGSPLNVLAAFVLSSLSFFALGFVLAGLLPTPRTAQIVAMVLFYPMIFLSGATIPREVLPEGIRQFAQVLPLSHVVTLLRGLWMGDPWEKHLTEAGVLAVLLIVGVVVSAKTFRWEREAG
jgi:ABC-2 type transport system permease protein